MKITILSGSDGDWVAVYKDGRKVIEDHRVGLEAGLFALGIDYEDREVDPEGFPADDLGPAEPDTWTGNEFPERL